MPCTSQQSVHRSRVCIQHSQFARPCLQAHWLYLDHEGIHIDVLWLILNDFVPDIPRVNHRAYLMYPRHSQTNTLRASTHPMSLLLKVTNHVGSPNWRIMANKSIFICFLWSGELCKCLRQRYPASAPINKHLTTALLVGCQALLFCALSYSYTRCA